MIPGRLPRGRVRRLLNGGPGKNDSVASFDPNGGVDDLVLRANAHVGSEISTNVRELSASWDVFSTRELPSIRFRLLLNRRQELCTQAAVGDRQDYPVFAGFEAQSAGVFVRFP
jgi:hypothetical protein